MRKTLILTTVLTMFIAAGLAPAVFADEGNQTRREKAQEQQEKAQEKREEAQQKAQERREEAQERKDGRGEGHGMRFAKSNSSLELNGTAVGNDNATYTFTISADGKGIERIKVRKDHNATGNGTGNASDPAKFRYHARMTAHVVVKDANGTIVREGDIRVQLFAKSDGNETKWILGSVAKGESGMPRLVLKGEATSDGTGAFDLVGKGKIVFKAGEESRATPVKVPSVSGTFTRA